MNAETRRAIQSILGPAAVVARTTVVLNGQEARLSPSIVESYADDPERLRSYLAMKLFPALSVGVRRKAVAA